MPRPRSLLSAGFLVGLLVASLGTSAGTASSLPAAATAGGSVQRVSGADRWSTSAAISAATYSPGVPVAYIASGRVFTDALSGAPAAGRAGGPVLLTNTTTLPTPIKAELTRLKPGRIVVLGGTTTISNAVKDALRAFTSTPVERVSGADRWSTSAAISAATYSPGVPVAYIASGRVFTDALSGAPAAGRAGGPVLLTNTTTLPTPIKAELTRLKPGRIVVLGGTTTISNAVKDALRAFTSTPVERVSGPDRWSTSAAISAATYSPASPSPTSPPAGCSPTPSPAPPPPVAQAAPSCSPTPPPFRQPSRPN